MFGAHADEHGDQVQIIVLSDDLEAGLQADAAPVAEQVIQDSANQKAHQSKLSAKRKAEAKAKAETHLLPKAGRRAGIQRIRTCSILWIKQSAGYF